MLSDDLVIDAVPGGFVCRYPNGESWEQRWRRLRVERIADYRARGLSQDTATFLAVTDPAAGDLFDGLCLCGVSTKCARFVACTPELRRVFGALGMLLS